MRRLLAAGTAAAILMAVSAPLGDATTTKLPFTLHEVVAEELAPGEWSMVGDVLSVRGAVWLATTTGTEAVEGTDTIVLNFDLDLTTGSGELWGTDRLEPTRSPGGGFACTWHGTYVDFDWSGKGVCHGDGALDGWQLRFAIAPGGDGYDLEGTYFLPSD